MFRVLWLLVVCFIVSGNIDAEPSNYQKNKHVAVIDAGSSGSRLYIYSYDLDKANAPIHIKNIWSKKVTPGFGSIAPDEQSINSYMTNLFAGAPEEAIPVYFYATAGMRLLPSPKQQVHYSNLKQWFAEQPTKKLVEARTITGQEEGIFGWLAVNYHHGTFDSPKQESVGVMDMGGASVQIAFPVPQGSQINNEDKVDFELYGKHILLFVHSFLGLGQTEVIHQFLNKNTCYTKGYQLPNGLPAQGDALACEQSISKLVTNVHDVNGIVQPILATYPVNSWYTIGGLDQLAKSKPLAFKNYELTSEGLLQQGNSKVCNQDWENLKAQYPKNDYLYAYCLSSAYYYALMVNGYGLKPESHVHYPLKNQKISWTLGVVLHQL